MNLTYQTKNWPESGFVHMYTDTYNFNLQSSFNILFSKEISLSLKRKKSDIVLKTNAALSES